MSKYLHSRLCGVFFILRYCAEKAQCQYYKHIRAADAENFQIGY